MTKGRHIILAAGGTGGHIFPAAALAQELKKRGHHVSLVTDRRGAQYDTGFSAKDVIVLDVQSVATGIWGKLSSLISILKARSGLKVLFKKMVPDLVVGFGGYPALPTLLAARSLNIPYILHEQNAVLGRVNRLVAKGSRALAVSFPATQRLPADRHVAVIGNPVRSDIAALSTIAYEPPSSEGGFRILVIGGSQGARILSDILPDAIACLAPPLQQRLEIIQQCRAEDIERVKQAYVALNTKAEAKTFIDDMAGQIKAAHLVIARAGASTVTEMAVAGQPAIYIPLPAATDNHQVYNARAVTDQKGGWLFEEKDLTAEKLGAFLCDIMKNPALLKQAAKAARKTALLHASQLLADMVEDNLPKAQIRHKSGKSSKEQFPVSGPELMEVCR